MIKIKYLLLTQFIAWIGLTMIDFLEEFFLIDLQFEACLFFPIIVGIFYFIKRKFIWKEKYRQLPIWKIMIRVLIFVLEWCFITVSVSTIITILVFNEIWIIPQGMDYFNGMEYPVYGFFLCIIPIVLILIGEIVIWFFGKCRTYLNK